ncbi:hypothetical protein HAX54_003301 [Datura stramonium]|uniref:Uncharacterized protein n=1 Tax=Datura stramonium TaxID=4076 RepID=A0ABS8WUL5_DATST|nr:hypothetical protein [Datura stramonium]
MGVCLFPVWVSSGVSKTQTFVLVDCLHQLDGKYGFWCFITLLIPDENGGFKLPYFDWYLKYLSFPEVLKIVDNGEEEGFVKKKKKKGGLKIKLKVSNPSLRRLISGAIAGAVSRTAVAPLETIRTHLMVGSSGHSSTEVFNNIMKTVLRTDCLGSLCRSQLHFTDISTRASHTRLTIQRGVYDGLLDAFVKILKEGGPAAGAISSTATFPLVARKHMQVGAVSGRIVTRIRRGILFRLEPGFKARIDKISKQ